MNQFRETEFVIVDVETTGLSPRTGGRVIELAAVKVKDLRVTDSFHSLIDPQCPISFGAYCVHGISSVMLEGAPTADQVMPSFLEFLGNGCIVGHNVGFDIKFLRHELARVGLSIPDGTVALDTLRMARGLLPDVGRYHLSAVAESLALDIAIRHRAMADVELTFEIFRCLLAVADRKDIGDMADLVRRFGKTLVNPAAKVTVDE